MAKIIRKLIILFLVSLLLCTLIFLSGKDLLTKNLIINLLYNNYHLRSRIGQLHLSILNPALTIKDLYINNPSGFPPDPMIRISDLSIRYNLPSILNGKVLLPEVDLFIKELYVIRNKDGKINLNISIPESGKSRFYIEKLRVRLDTLFIRDEPLSIERKIEVNLEREFSCLSSLDDVIKTISGKGLIPIPLSQVDKLIRLKWTDPHT